MDLELLPNKNAIRSINSGKACNDLELIVQILDIKMFSSYRYRIVISDGVDYMPALAGPKIHQNISLNEIVENQVIKITEFSIKEVWERNTVFIIDDLEAGAKLNGIFGKPNRYDLSDEENRN